MRTNGFRDNRPFSQIMLSLFFALFLLAGQPALAHGILVDSSTAAGQVRGQASNHGMNLDLSSQTATVVAGANLFARATSVSLNLGGAQKLFQAGDLVTPAEYVALKQLSMGQNSLVLAGGGQAAGGSLLLTSLGTNLFSSLVIPQGVTVSSLGFKSTLNVLGLLSTQGNLLGCQGPSGGLIIRAGDVQVGAGGSISTVTTKSVDLGLYSLSDITNGGTIAASGVLTLNAVGSIVNALPAGTSGGQASISGKNGVNLFAGSGQFTNAGTIASSTGSININTFDASNLVFNNLSGQVLAALGSINIRDASFGGSASSEIDSGVLTAANINLNGGTGTIKAIVDEFNGTVNVNAGCANVYANSGSLNLGAFNVSGDPTIANSGGDVVLNQSLTFNGQNLAILASGNVTTTKNVPIKIDLSSATGNAGNLSIIAGYTFNPPTSGQVTDNTTTYTLSSPSNSGGGVLLSTSSIDTSSSGGNGGNVTIIARNAPDPLNNGYIFVGSINTSSSAGSSGSVRCLGAAGVNVAGSVNAVAQQAAGSVVIAGAPTQIEDGTISYTNGVQGGNGVFVLLNPQVGSGAAVQVAGPIATTALIGSAGGITLVADQSVNVGGGGLFAYGGLGGSGGEVGIRSLEGGVFIQGNIATRGGIGQSQAGNGGHLFVSVANQIFVKGNIDVSGGNSGLGNGGDSGGVEMSTAINALGTSPREVSVGQIVVGGSINSTGGRAFGSGSGGDGGDVFISSGTLQVLGSSAGGAGISINASAGAGGVLKQQGGGTISLNTFGVQPVPTDFNLVSANQDMVALPGGLFTAQTNNPINGTKGTIVSGGDVANKSNAASVTDPGFSTGNVNINVTNSSFNITEDGSSKTINVLSAGKRTMVTPGEALALYQVSRDSSDGAQTIGLDAQGLVTDTNPQTNNSPSVATITAFEIFQPFTAFNMVTTGTNQLTITVKGSFANLVMPANSVANFGGTLNFISGGDPLVQINLFGQPLNILPGGQILGTDNTQITISGSSNPNTLAGTWAILGNLEAGTINLIGQTGLNVFMLQSSELGSPDANPGTVTLSAPRGPITTLGGIIQGSTLFIKTGFGDVNVSTDFSETAKLGNVVGGNLFIDVPDTDLTIANGTVLNGASVIVQVDTGNLFLGSAAGLGVTVQSNSGILFSAGEAITENSSGSSFVSATGNRYVAIAAGLDSVSLGQGTTISSAQDVFIASQYGGVDLTGSNVITAKRDLVIVAQEEVTIGAAGTADNFKAGGNLAIVSQVENVSLNVSDPLASTFSATKGNVFISGVSIEIGQGSIISSGFFTQIVSNATTTIDAGVTIAAAGELDLINAGITIGKGDHISAGVLRSSAPATGVLTAANIQSPGPVFINDTSSNGITINSGTGSDQTTITSNGNDVAIFSGGNISFGDFASLQANGGNVLMLAGSGDILGGSSDSFTARAVGSASNFTGGGVEFGAGVAIPSVQDILANRPAHFTIIPAGQPTGATINNNNIDKGVVFTDTSGGGTVKLNNGGTNTTINVFGGVVVFEGVDQNVTLNNGTIRVYAPVSSENITPDNVDNDIVDTGDATEDDTMGGVASL